MTSITLEFNEENKAYKIWILIQIFGKKLEFEWFIEITSLASTTWGSLKLVILEAWMIFIHHYVAQWFTHTIKNSIFLNMFYNWYEFS
jgi:hypothetical protein